jgi:hypothetical protein
MKNHCRQWLSGKYRRLALAYLLAPVPAFIIWAILVGLGNHYQFMPTHLTAAAIYTLLVVQAVFGFIFLVLWFLKISKWFAYPLTGFLVCWPFAAIFWILASGDWALSPLQLLQFVITHLSDFSLVFLLSTEFALLIGALPGFAFWFLANPTLAAADTHSDGA